MWPSREIASFVYHLANIGLIIGLVIGLISTGILIWMGNVKEEYLKRDVGEADIKAAQANKDAAAASERAAVLEKQAKEEQEKRLRIEQGLSSRHIPNAKKPMMHENLLRGVSVSIMELADEEAEPYGDEIATLLRSLGAMVQVGKGNVVIPPPVGVRVRFDHDDPRTAAVFSALKEAGIDPIDDGPSPNNSVVYIRVGVKPRQF